MPIPLRYKLSLCLLAIPFTGTMLINKRATQTIEKEAHIIESMQPSSSFQLRGYIETSKLMKEEFHKRYGGEYYAAKLLTEGISEAEVPIKTKPDNVNATAAPSGDIDNLSYTAKRILYAIASSKPFVMSFGGYSVTAGRGNLLNQSYPLVLEHILQPAMEQLGVDEFIVRNAASGGAPAFPYGWCFPNFLGNDADVISWEFSMNEVNTVTGLEAYLRHAIAASQKKSPPVFLLMGNYRPRFQLLQQYVDNGSLLDAVGVGGDGGEELRKEYFDKVLNVTQDLDAGGEEEHLHVPVGFRNWTDWGAPKGTPGQFSWHPKYKTHELKGWIIAMHFMKKMDEVAEFLLGMGQHQRKIDRVGPSSPSHFANWREDIVKKMDESKHILRKPIHELDVETDLSSLLYGVPLSKKKDGDKKDINGISPLWTMNHISCRTTFQPVLDKPTSLLNLVVSGIQPDEDLHNMLVAKDPLLYDNGWVYDIAPKEKKITEKAQLAGYIDSKVALFGRPSSGWLRIWIPLGNTTTKDTIKTLVVCEPNIDPQNKNLVCKLREHARFMVGGSNVTNVKSVRSAKAYMGLAYYVNGGYICVHMKVPSGVKLAERPSKTVTNSLDDTDGIIGTFLDVMVVGTNATLNETACAISHVIWETHDSGHSE